jgi:hydroxyacylglutathione hydrolase
MPVLGRISWREFAVGWLGTNCYLLWDIDSRQTIVIDPGAPDKRILETIRSEKLAVTAILNTHGHADHIAGNKIIKETTQAPLLIHEKDREMLRDSALNLSQMFGAEVISPDADQLLNQTCDLKLAGQSLEIIETPGHTPGSVCLKIDSLLFSGDTLFCGSIGRTDIPGGDGKQILKSIQKQILPLQDEIQVLPGHGPSTTIGQEKRQNPFLQDTTLF